LNEPTLANSEEKASNKYREIKFIFAIVKEELAETHN
jgi:hypothetical protein